MTLPEEALRKLTKDELVNLSLEYQSKFNSTLANIDKDMSELRNDFKKLEADLVISRAVNTKLRDNNFPRASELECSSASVLQNVSTPECQYSSRESQEITGLPDDINNEDLEEKARMIFEKLNVTADSSNVEDCHWLPGNQNKDYYQTFKT